MDLAKLLDVLTSLPVSNAILPRAVCFAMSRPASHAICSFIDLSGYASGPIRRCLFIDYIINPTTDLLQKSDPIHPNPDRSYQGWHAAWTDDGCGTSRDWKD